jgi:AcrR family transcriptional regulator
MPRPRFDKLSPRKRERILEASAREFAANGYDGASMNRILDAAGISKGAAYYYFDDKADLYATTVSYYSQELISVVDPSQFQAASFWDELISVYRHQFTSYAERPWVFGVVKAGGSLSPETMSQGPLAELWQQAQFLLVQLLRRGRELRVIRTDLEEELLLSLIIAVDTAHDRWLFAHWSELSPDDLEQAALRIGDTMRRLLAPQ